MSLTIIDKIKPKVVPYTFVPTPTFRNTYEKEKYWAGEKVKWVEGIPDITGKHYFYMSQGHIKDIDGNIFPPWYRDVDQWMFELIDKAEAMEYDAGIIKRREIGLTSIGAGCLPNYTMKVYPGTTSIMTSCDKKRIYKMFFDKTAVFYDGMHKDIRPIKKKRSEREENVNLIVKVRTKLDNGETVTKLSDILCSETVKNPTAFSTVRCKYGFYDEFPLHKNRTKLLASSRPCFMKSEKKAGLLLWGGTVEKGISIETLQALRNIVADAKNSETLIFFVEPWMGFIMHEGGNYSDKKKGIEHIEKKRERLYKLSDKEEYYAYIKNFPLSLEEALESTATGVFPPEITDKINQQNRIIIQTPPPVANHKLIKYPEGKIVAKPNIEGKFIILSQPEKGITYIGGIDPIPFNDANLADGSEHCIAIKDYDHDTYVAYYAERNFSADIIATNSILLQDYYFGAPAMLERNMGGALKEKYKEYGRMELLSDKPMSLGIKFVDKNMVKGWFKNPKTSAKGNEYLIKYLLHHTENIWFERLIKELEEYLTGKNTDLLDAVISCEILDANMTRRNAKKMKVRRVREIPQIVRDPSTGATKIVMKKIYV